MTVLDIIGQFDYQTIQKRAKARARLAVDTELVIKAIGIIGSDHQFNHAESVLAQRIHVWLNKYIL